MGKIGLFWVGVAFSVLSFIVGIILVAGNTGASRNSNSSVGGLGVGLGIAGIFGVVLFVSCLGIKKIESCGRCFRGCCGGGVGATGTINNGEVGIQLQPLPAIPIAIPQPSLPQQNLQSLRVVGNYFVDERGNVVGQVLNPTVPVASSSVIMVPQYSAQQQFQQPPLYNAYK